MSFINYFLSIIGRFAAAVGAVVMVVFNLNLSYIIARRSSVNILYSPLPSSVC